MGGGDGENKRTVKKDFNGENREGKTPGEGGGYRKENLAGFF